MEPVAIAIIGAVVFGAMATLAIFVRQLIMSRDRSLNEKAHKKALDKENEALKKMRTDFTNSKRFDAHYKVLKDNKDAIEYLDLKIDKLLKKKFKLITDYSKLSLEASASIIDGQLSLDKKNICDVLRNEIDDAVKIYNTELEQLQLRRSNEWKVHTNLQNSLIEQENSKNQALDQMYNSHTGLLEKLYLRYNETIDNITEKNIEAASKDLSFFNEPFKFLIELFKSSFSQTVTSTDSNSTIEKMSKEIAKRKEIVAIEEDIIMNDGVSTLNVQKDDKMPPSSVMVDLIT